MLGYPAVALLDRDGVYGAPRFHKAAKAAGIEPLIGAELTLGCGLGAGDWALAHTKSKSNRSVTAGHAPAPSPQSLAPVRVLVSSQEG